MLDSLRACGKRGRWRIALDIIAELETEQRASGGSSALPDSAWRDVLLACRKHRRLAEMLDLVTRMKSRQMDTAIVNELLHAARIEEDYQLALLIWRAMRGEPLGGGRAPESAWGPGSGADGEADSNGLFAASVGDDVAIDFEDLEATRTVAASQSSEARAKLLASAASAAEVIAQAASERPEAVRPDGLSYQHMLTMCGPAGRWSEALELMGEMCMPLAEPTTDGQPEALATHLFAAVRACTRDRRWREAVQLARAVPPSMFSNNKFFSRLVLGAAAAAPDAALASQLVTQHLRGIATHQDYAALLRAARASRDVSAARGAWDAMRWAGIKPDEQCFAQVIGSEVEAAVAARQAAGLGVAAGAGLSIDLDGVGGAAEVQRATALLREAASVLEPPQAGVVLTASLGSAVSGRFMGLATESIALLHAAGLPVDFAAQVRVLEVGAELGQWHLVAAEAAAAAKRHAASVEAHDRQALSTLVATARLAEAEGSARTGAVGALTSLLSGNESLPTRPYNGRGKLSLDGTPAAEERRLASRRYSKSIAISADESPIEVLFEDDSLLAVSKPAGVSTVPRHRFEGESMVNRVVHYLGGRSPYVLHRLDNPTSGVLLFGKNRPAARSLAKQFSLRHLSKVYLAALCCADGAASPPDSFDVEAPIARHPTSSLLSWIPTDDGEAMSRAQRALTHFRTVGRAARVVLCEAQPVTGRMHQIRIHAEHAGWPIAGDTQYGAALQPEPQCGRLLLHAHSLQIEHPELGTPMRFVAPVPEDYLAELERLGLDLSLPELTSLRSATTKALDKEGIDFGNVLEANHGTIRSSPLAHAVHP
jgi:23S rRNA pseudouridine1911/1915/1917 synthase